MQKDSLVTPVPGPRFNKPPLLGFAPKLKLKIKIDVKNDEFDQLLKEPLCFGEPAVATPFRAGTKNKIKN